GPVVERLQEEVAARFPEARTALMVSDLLMGPRAAAELADAMVAHRYDVLIGTQIVAKGHHFPMLTLVGVVDADLGLIGGDLRATERTYQLLHQVAGRAGRAERPGRVLLQTYMPEQPVMQALAAGDRDGFLEAAAAGRYRRLQLLVIPSARSIALLRVRSYLEQRQWGFLGFAAEEHRHDAQEREAGHDRRALREAAEITDEQPRDQRPRAGHDAPGAVAERHRRRAHMGREELGQVDGVAGEDAEHEEAVDGQEVGVIGVVADPQIENESERQRPEIIKNDRRAAADQIGDETEQRVAEDAADAPQ